MIIRSVAHKGLKRLITTGSTAGIAPKWRGKVEAIVGFLAAAPDIDAVRRFRLWRVHSLTGDRDGTWSLSVSRNWRMTFRINGDGEIEDLDLEDYH
jgi:proteic killer suppression protein